MNEQILIVEDEEDITKLMTYNLSQEGYIPVSANTSDMAISKIENSLPDLILLDIMIPGIDGFELCKKLKSEDRTKHVPIIMVSAKSQEHNIITGLELGADDYITKPFSINILIARIRTILRKEKSTIESEAHQASSGIIRVNNIEINTHEISVNVDKKRINLNHTEFKIITCLAKKAGWVFTRNQLLDAIKGEDSAVTDRSIDVLMVAIRKKMGAAAKYIETVRGAGYRLKNPD